MTDFTFIRHNMLARGRLFVTVMTTLMLALAAAALFCLLTFVSAGTTVLERSAGNMHLLISRDGTPLRSVLDSVFYVQSPQRALLWSEYKAVKAQYPFEWAIPTQIAGRCRGFAVVGTTREFFEKFEPDGRTPWALQSGSFFNDGPAREVVLGWDCAQETSLQVGDQIDLADNQNHDASGPSGNLTSEFRVAGILQPTGTSQDHAMFTSLVSRWIMQAQRAVQQDGEPVVKKEILNEADLSDSDKRITAIMIRLPTRQPGSNMPPPVLQEVESQLQADPAVQNLIVAQPGAEITGLLPLLERVRMFFALIGGLLLALSGIGIMLALYNAGDQRREQAAILRVLGCSRWRLAGMVLTESALIGLIGAAAGVGVGILLCEVFAAASDGLRAIIGRSVESGLDWNTVVIVMIATICMATLAGIIPAALAYRSNKLSL